MKGWSATPRPRTPSWRRLQENEDRQRFAADDYADANTRLVAMLDRHLADEEDLIIPLILERGDRGARHRLERLKTGCRSRRRVRQSSGGSARHAAASRRSALAPPSARAARRCWLRCSGRGRTMPRWRRCPTTASSRPWPSACFRAGFVWRVIEQKWPGFEEAFLGFEPKRLLFQPDDFWHDLTSDKRIVRNPQKIRSVRENAAFVERVVEGAWQLRQVSRAMAGGRPGRPDGLSRQAWQPARRQHRRSISCAGSAGIASSSRTTWPQRLRDAGLDIAESPTSKSDLAEGAGADQRLGGRPACRACHISRILAMSIGENHSPEALRAYMGE